MLNNVYKVLERYFCQKIFCPCFYCLKSFAELINDIFKQKNPFFWMFTIVEQLQQNFHWKFFVRKYFALVFIVWNALLSWSMIFLTNKTHFSGWSRWLNNFNKIFMKKFLSENILSHCFLSEIFFRASKWNFLTMKFISLAGHDCWKSFLKLQLYRAVLSSCPTKNS